MRIVLAVVCVLVSSSAVASSIDKEAIRRPIRRVLPQITRCYDKQLLANPKLADGKIIADFTIGKAGQVTDATASGFDDAVADCVANVIRGLRFPRSPSGAIRVSYPFEFRQRLP